MSDNPLPGRLIIVSNRLPVSVRNKGQGQYHTEPSSGGLVTGVRGLAKSGMRFLWFGWPGIEIPRENVSRLERTLLKDHDAIPVPLDQRTSDLYYDGFSNSTLWPLLHRQLERVHFDPSSVAAYRKANKIFADTIACHLRDGDHVWVHDYHLMPLPLMLRQKAERMNIKITLGWFLHTPLPECDIFDILASKEEILNGVLGADVVGFQTDQARRNFLNTCSHILKWWSTDAGILYGHREVRAQVFPIGIEPSEFHLRLQKPCVQDAVLNMRDGFNGCKVILGVDRLDCIKGIPQKLHAFDALLEQHPELVGNVVLLQVTIPSRDGLKAHQDLKEEIQQLVGKINGKYGQINYVPVHFLYTCISPEELTALYTAADVCFISSIQDGMNLVCFEYVACHSGNAIQSSRKIMTSGSLVLSKFAGAACHMDGALIVNPWDKTDCADVLSHALSMSADEAIARMKTLGYGVEQQTSSRWGCTFIQALEHFNKSRSTKAKNHRDSAIALNS